MFKYTTERILKKHNNILFKKQNNVIIRGKRLTV